MIRLALIAPVALILATSSVFAMPRRTRAVVVSSAVVVSPDASGSEIGADGETRHMLSFNRAAVSASERTTEQVMACDVVELAQGNGMVRRCFGGAK